jgi:hypothetical protein
LAYVGTEVSLVALEEYNFDAAWGEGVVSELDWLAATTEGCELFQSLTSWWRRWKVASGSGLRLAA